jgi:hypothetical protein
MAFKSTITRFTHNLNNAGVLDTVYTVPGGKIFLLRGMSLLFVEAVGGGSQQANLVAYVLPSGGTDYGANVNSVKVELTGGSNAMPLLLAASPVSGIPANALPYTLTANAIDVLYWVGPVASSPVSNLNTAAADRSAGPQGVLNAGDAIKLKFWNSEAVARDLYAVIWIFGEEV